MSTSKVTPMMEQYLSIKKDYQDTFLFYRLGDFYELFYEDAELGAQLLELTLTARNKQSDQPVPMCGVPYHSAEDYIEKLIEQGYKVAICEQMEPASSKGMVSREVVRVITPGTFIKQGEIQYAENNYLAAVLLADSYYYFAYVDISTGELKVTTLISDDQFIEECATLYIKELIVTQSLDSKVEESLMQYLPHLVISKWDIDRIDFSQGFSQDLTKAISENMQKKVIHLLGDYLYEMQKQVLNHIQPAKVYDVSRYLHIDYFSKRNLELETSLRSNHKEGSLLWVIDDTQTAMGRRLLKQWINRPLLDQQEILSRQHKVGDLLAHFFERMELIDTLKNIYDIERLASKVSLGTITPREFIRLKESLKYIPQLFTLCQSIASDEDMWKDILDALTPLPELVDLIHHYLLDHPAISLTEGGLIKRGVDPQLDQFHEAMTHGKEWILALEQKERELTGIKNLKIKYNKVFGYFIEVTKSYLSLVPEDRYVRKQTLSNAERYITEELKEKERLILTSESQAAQLEYDLFLSLKEQIVPFVQPLQAIAKAVAMLDVFQSFASVSEQYHYIAPQFNNNNRSVHLKDARHPVIEKVIGAHQYVPNDIIMDEDTSILLITGPNMAGKSTYMRQFALNVILAQMGCFVPCSSATLPIFDQIFTRIGASDDLMAGQSTFMVEMMEANQALTYATHKSLLLFDEIGRGTATYDGMALAQAMLIYLHDHVQAKTLFSTHYHELTQLEQTLPALKNIHVLVSEESGQLVFLHQFVPGAADKSYGIHVAALAGLPEEVLTMASSILEALEQQQINNKNTCNEFEGTFKENNTDSDAFVADERSSDAKDQENVDLYLEKISSLDLLNMTLIESMQTLLALQKEAKSFVKRG